MYEKTNFTCFDDAKVVRFLYPRKLIQRIARLFQ